MQIFWLHADSFELELSRKKLNKTNEVKYAEKLKLQTLILQICLYMYIIILYMYKAVISRTTTAFLSYENELI